MRLTNSPMPCQANKHNLLYIDSVISKNKPERCITTPLACLIQSDYATAECSRRKGGQRESGSSTVADILLHAPNALIPLDS